MKHEQKFRTQLKIQSDEVKVAVAELLNLGTGYLDVHLVCYFFSFSLKSATSWPWVEDVHNSL